MQTLDRVDQWNLPAIDPRLRELARTLTTLDTREIAEEIRKTMAPAKAEALLKSFQLLARNEQLPSRGDWIGWLLSTGRGFGKTRTGSEFIKSMVDTGLSRRIGLIGRTMSPFGLEAFL